MTTPVTPDGKLLQMHYSEFIFRLELMTGLDYWTLFVICLPSAFWYRWNW